MPHKTVHLDLIIMVKRNNINVSLVFIFMSQSYGKSYELLIQVDKLAIRTLMAVVVVGKCVKAHCVHLRVSNEIILTLITFEFYTV